MIENPKNKRIVSCDATVLTAMQGCHYNWNLTYRENWKPNLKEEPLEKGDLAHKMLEHYYRGIKFIQDTSIELNRLELINECVDIGRTKASDLGIPIEETERIIQIIVRYFHNPRYINDEGNKIIAVEQPFSYILFENDELIIVMDGAIDLIYESSLTKLTVMDHKTMSRDYTMQHRSNQFVNYATAFDTHWVIANKIGLQKNKSDEERYQRQTMNVTDFMKKQWKETAIETILEGIQAIDTGNFRRKFRFCTDFGKACQYTPVCDAPDESLKLYKLTQGFYKGKPWSPYTKD